jgi:hypothetical protein
MVLFNYKVSLLIFFGLDDLSSSDTQVLTSPTIIVLGLSVLLSSVVCLMKWDVPTLGAISS